MNLREFGGLIFLLGLGVLLIAVLTTLPYSNSLTGVGNNILAQAPTEVGTANIVTAVVLAYRGLDTLGELLILFVASTAVGMILNKAPGTACAMPPLSNTRTGFIFSTAASLLFPFLILLGSYVILHGHLTPGGGFQGGAILAAAFFIPILVSPASPFKHAVSSLLETGAGLVFIGIGLVALFGSGYFLAPLGYPGTPGALLSAGSLPFLYLAVGIKVGAELAGIVAHLAQP